MELIILGSGGSIMSKSRSYPAFLINDEILLDCGEGTTQKLLQLDKMDKIDVICLTHLHNDHFMGLFSLLWYFWLTGRKEPITIIGPPETEKTVRKILELAHTPVNMGDFGVNYIELKDNAEIQEFECGIVIKARKMEHGTPSFAYRIEDETSNLTYSGDTRANQALINLSERSDLLICEATFPDKMRNEAHRYNHCTPSEAGNIAQKAGVKELILVHISPVFKNLMPKMKHAAEEQFQGKVTLGKDLLVIRI